MEPTMRELWEQAEGDREKYKSLLRQHDYLVKRKSVPGNHPFQGLTRLCLCDVCRSSFDSPWHQSQD